MTAGVAPSGDDARYIGVDVGGTKVLAVAVAEDPTVVLAAAEHPTVAGDGVRQVIARVVGELLADPALAGGRPVAIGVGMPGLVTLGGLLRYGPNLPGALELEVDDWLQARFGLPVAVDNDGNCAAWAEHAHGGGAGADDVVFVGLGTGISCGLVIGGRRVRGVHGFAGEPGHMTVLADGPRCACGRLGCWEALASGSALAAQAQAAALSGRAPGLVAAAGGDPEAVRGEHVTAALRRGDPDAAAIADTFARWVGLGVANLVHLLDPAVVVLGGSVLHDAEPWLGRLRAAYHQAVLGGPLRTGTAVVAATLGRQAGAIGAALLARECVAERREPRV